MKMKEKFVVVAFYEHEPVQIYGTFDSPEAAREWAEAHGADAYNINAILDIEEN